MNNLALISIIDHQSPLSKGVSDFGHSFGISLFDVSKPTSTHCRTKLIAQSIDGLGNSGAFVLPHVICKSQRNTNLRKEKLA